MAKKNTSTDEFSMSISSGKSEEGTNQNQNMNSMNAMNGVMNDSMPPSTPGSLSGKLQNGLQQLNSIQQQQQSNNESGTPKPVIERGASWSYNETRILLSLWGQDMVQRQLTNSKRTRHVWEKIAEKIKEYGFQRTAEQVRTRVFNMIAEYRRILKNPTPERKKKCIFFDALHKIYQAKDAQGVRQALNNYEEEYNLEPIEFGNMDDQNDNSHYNDNEHDNSDSGNEDKSEIFSYALSPSHFNGVNMNMNGITNDHGSSDGQEDNEMIVNTQPAYKRMRSEVSNQSHNLNNLSNLNNHSLNFNNNQAQSNAAFDIASNYDCSAILIDRMFSHLTKETEVMREWVVLERERLRQEITRKKEESDREERREKQFLNTLMKMQSQMFDFLARSQSAKELNALNNGQLSNRNEQHLNGGLNDHNGEYDEDMN